MHTASWRASLMLLLLALVASAFARDAGVNVVRRQDDVEDTSTFSPSSDGLSATTASIPTMSFSSSDALLLLSSSSAAVVVVVVSSATSSSLTAMTSPPITSSTSITSSLSTSQSSSASIDSSTSSSPSVTSSSTRPTTTIPHTSSSSSTRVTKKTTVTSALVAKTTIKSSHTIATTVNGKATSKVVETDRVVSHTTGYAISTLSPSLSDGGDGDSSSNGMSSAAKKIIGGIVGTIGGVMLLGGIAIVIWRIYGRKRHYNDVDDGDITSIDNSIMPEKRRGSSLPFTDSLEKYHQPSARVNVGSNF